MLRADLASPRSRTCVKIAHLTGNSDASSNVIAIDDPADPRLADYVGLSDPELRRRVESERGFFIAESAHVVRRLLASRQRVRSVLLTPVQYDALAVDLEARLEPVYVAPIDVLRAVAGFDLHRGVVAAADRWPLPDPAEVLADARCVAVGQGLNDHENLGVLFRNAAAFGIDAVLLDSSCADPLYRRCVRVSIGHVLTVPWTRIASLAELAAAGFTIVALTPEAGALALDELDWPERVALLLGAEGPGLSAAWLAAADVRVRIPMAVGVDSLNVATAAAVAFYVSRGARRL
jgi:tRNA G18 (ribose-2'-O)-methylase SpoU